MINLLNPIALYRRFRKENSYIEGMPYIGIIIDYSLSHRYINKTSYEILKLCDGKHSLDDIISIILKKYTGPRHRIIADIINFINMGVDIGFINIDNESFKEIYQPMVDETELSPEPLVGYVRAPITIYYEITYACNLRCNHCYSSSGKPLENELSFDDISKLVYDLSEMKVVNVALGGGEPLLREDITRVVDCMISKGIGVSIATNGTLFDWSIAEELWSRGLRDIQFSLDGATTEVHDKIRGISGTFEKVIRAIKIAQSIGYNVSIKTIIQKQNWEQIPKIMALALDLGVGGLQFGRAVPYGRAKENLQDIFISYENYAKIVKELYQIRSRSERRLIVDWEPLMDYVNERNIPNDEVIVGCPAALNSISLGPDGVVKPCSYFPDEFSCGNIRKTPLQEIWISSSLLQLLRNVRLSDLMEPCRSCKVQACYGKCRGAASAFFKDIYAPDPLCPIVEEKLNLKELVTEAF